MIWLCAMGLAALIFLYGCVQSGRARLALRWPCVTGTVLRRHVRPVQPDADPLDAEEYLRDFAYEYQVGGRTYTGQRVELRGDLTRSSYQTWLSQPVERFEPGSSAKVFYNPMDPSQSMVSKVELVGQRAHVALFWGLLLGLGMLALAAAPNRFQAHLNPPDLSPWLAQLSLPAVLGLALALCAGWLLWRLLLPVRLALLFQRLPATVLTTRVQYFRENNPSAGGTQARYRPYMEYEYEVGGTVYQANRLAWDLDSQTWWSERAAKREQPAARVGESIDVWVHKLDPATAVVDGRLTGLHLATPLMLVALLGGATWYAHHRAAVRPVRAQAAAVAPAGKSQIGGPRDAEKPAPTEEKAAEPHKQPAHPARHKAKHAK